MHLLDSRINMHLNFPSLHCYMNAISSVFHEQKKALLQAILQNINYSLLYIHLYMWAT